jgi:hypothetical protein
MSFFCSSENVMTPIVFFLKEVTLIKSLTIVVTSSASGGLEMLRPYLAECISSFPLVTFKALKQMDSKY